MTPFHLLNGDALLERVSSFIDSEEIAVAREILMEGPTKFENETKFWKNRAKFISKELGESLEDYLQNVPLEFEKLKSLSPSHKIYCWFEEDLFCQTNFWFSVFYLSRLNLKHDYFWVKPLRKNWMGFGDHSVDDLKKASKNAIQLSTLEIDFLIECWNHYQQNTLSNLSNKIPERFSFLHEVFEAQAQRSKNSQGLNRPENTLIKISNRLKTQEFSRIFKEFMVKEGVYGYGDLQVKKMWDGILKNHANLLV